MFGALIGGHERFAEEPCAEVRDDHGHRRMTGSHRRDPQRIPEPEVERRRQPETLADPDGQHPAVDEHGSARIRSDFEHRLDDRIVQAIAVHRRKERNDPEMPALEQRDEARASIAGAPD